MGIGSLPNLGAGELGVVESIAGRRCSSKRLADMGFVRGARITMVRPGEPCIVRIGGRCVGLGIDHQESVLLQAE